MRWRLAATAFSIVATVAPLFGQSGTVVQRADSAYFRADYLAAARNYAEVLKSDTANAAAWFHMGVSQHKLGNYREAAIALLKGRALGFQPFFSQLWIARADAKLGDRSGAVVYLDSAAAGAIAQGAPPGALADDGDFESVGLGARFSDTVARVKNARYPCGGGTSTTQFDFWIGKWDVSQWSAPNAAPASSGVNDVHPILEHCVIFENWEGRLGGSGKSFNFFDTNVGKWRQIWVADGGGSLDYTGEFRDGAMRFQGFSVSPKGQRTLQRLTFTPFGRDTVRQTFESSTDEGKTWTTGFDGRYVRQRSP